MKKREILNLYHDLRELRDLSGVKFAYAIARNLSILEGEIKSLEEAIVPTEEFKVFEKERIELAEKHSNKDKNGSSIKKTNQQGIQEYDIKDMNAFDKELNKIRKKYKDAIAFREKQYKEYKELLDTDSEIELYKIKLDDVPENINVRQMEIIKNLIE